MRCRAPFVFHLVGQAGRRATNFQSSPRSAVRSSLVVPYFSGVLIGSLRLTNTIDFAVPHVAHRPLLWGSCAGMELNAYKADAELDGLEQGSGQSEKTAVNTTAAPSGGGRSVYQLEVGTI